MASGRPIAVSLAVVAVFAAAAGLLRWFGFNEIEKLPSSYSNQTQYDTLDEMRVSPSAAWEKSTLLAKRVDQAVYPSGPAVIIQSTYLATTQQGILNFESTGLYALDPLLRTNLPGYSEIERGGQFYFPTHTQPVSGTIWDAQFIGPRQVTFLRSDMIEGTPVLVFQFSAANLDETAGYAYLAEVPDPYHTLTDGSGTLWVEPLSGRIVQYAEQGVSYFVRAASGEKVIDFHRWSSRYTAQTSQEQLAAARQSAFLMQLFEVYLPGGLILMGLAGAAWILLRKRKAAVSETGTSI